MDAGLCGGVGRPCFAPIGNIGIVQDTDPRIREVWLEALRKITPGDKLRLVFEMNEFMHNAVIAQIRKQHPGISEWDMLRELARRRYGSELAERVYPRCGSE